MSRIDRIISESIQKEMLYEGLMDKVKDKEALKKLIKAVGLATAATVLMALPEKFGMDPTGGNVPEEQLDDIPSLFGGTRGDSLEESIRRSIKKVIRGSRYND